MAININIKPLGSSKLVFFKEGRNVYSGFILVKININFNELT